MNILFLVNSGLFGGVEQHVYDLAKGLLGRGHGVFIWCKAGPIAEEYNALGINVNIRNINFDIDPLYIFSLRKFIKQNKIQVVHTHELKAGVNGLLAAKLANVKSKISHVHTPMSQWQSASKLEKIMFKVESFFYSKIVNAVGDYEVALTSSIKEIKVTEGISAAKLIVIPNAIDSSKFKLSSQERDDFRVEVFKSYGLPINAFIIGVLGRMAQEKGHKIALEAFSELLKNYSDNSRPVYLMFVGGGALESELKTFSKQLGINENVIFTGVFPESEKIKYCSSFDLFLFPSLAEGFGIVLLEAMSLGLPCLISDLPVLVEVSNNQALTFKSGDVEDLSKKLLEVLRMEHFELNELGVKLEKTAETKFNMHDFIQNYINLYENIATR